MKGRKERKIWREGKGHKMVMLGTWESDWSKEVGLG